LSRPVKIPQKNLLPGGAFSETLHIAIEGFIILSYGVRYSTRASAVGFEASARSQPDRLAFWSPRKFVN
jgi:hypothetical protein